MRVWEQIQSRFLQTNSTHLAEQAELFQAPTPWRKEEKRVGGRLGAKQQRLRLSYSIFVLLEHIDKSEPVSPGSHHQALSLAPQKLLGDQCRLEHPPRTSSG